MCNVLLAGYAFDPLQNESSNQGMLIATLHDKHSGAIIIAATAHLKAKAGPKNDAIRDHQAKQLLAQLSRAQRSLCDGFPPQPIKDLSQSCELGPPLVILCGDLNTTPDSSTCQLITEHSSHLRSSWETYPSNKCQSSMDTKQPFSTWKFRSDGESKRIIDYIWYSADDRLQLASHWQLPSEDSIGDAGLPSLEYPSDHLALCCCFNLSQ